MLASPAQRATLPEQGERAPGSRAVLPAGAPAHPHHVTNLSTQALPPAAAPGSAARAGPSGAVQETLGYPNPAAPAGLALAPGAARGAAVKAGEALFLPSSPGAFTPAALTPSFWWGTATAAYQVRPYCQAHSLLPMPCSRPASVGHRDGRVPGAPQAHAELLGRSSLCCKHNLSTCLMCYTVT